MRQHRYRVLCWYQNIKNSTSTSEETMATKMNFHGALDKAQNQSTNIWSRSDTSIQAFVGRVVRKSKTILRVAWLVRQRATNTIKGGRKLERNVAKKFIHHSPTPPWHWPVQLPTEPQCLGTLVAGIAIVKLEDIQKAWKDKKKSAKLSLTTITFQ